MLDKIEKDKIRKDSRKDLTEVEQEVFDMVVDGLTQEEIAKKRGVCQQAVSQAYTRITKKGHKIEKSLENKAIPPLQVV